MALTLEVSITVLDLPAKRISVSGTVTDTTTSKTTPVKISNTIYDSASETRSQFETRIATILWLQYQATATKQSNIDTIVANSEAAIKTLFDAQGA